MSEDKVCIETVAATAGRAASRDAPEPGYLRALLDESGLADLPENPPLLAVEAVLKRIVVRSNGLNPLQRRIVETEVRRTLKARQVQRVGQIVEAAFRAGAGEAFAADGGALMFDDPAPWDTPVHGAELLSEISGQLTRHLILPEGAAEAIALWSTYTFAFDLFDYSPILAITSPMKRCGKTKVVDLVSNLVRRPLSVSHTTTAALFRIIERDAPTVLVDEFDTFLTGNEEMRGILNSGHFRRNARVIRCTGDDHDPRPFSTWAPKLVAGIGQLPSTVADRSIIVQMRRRLEHEDVASTRREVLELQCGVLRRKLVRWVQDNEAMIRECDPRVPEQLHDRARDNWRPLLAIAAVVGEGWVERASAAALALASETEQDLGAEAQLLGDIRAIFTATKAERLESRTILDTLTSMDERPWGAFRNGRPMTPHQLADALRPFGVQPKKMRLGLGTVRGYELESFRELFLRYLPPDTEQSEPTEHGPETPSSRMPVPPVVRNTPTPEPSGSTHLLKGGSGPLNS